jgi:hypothetical protein
MTGRSLPRWLPLLLAASGCLSEDGKPMLVSADPFGGAPRLPPPQRVAHAPATEETARRVTLVGEKVLTSNRQIGLHPLFLTVGSPQPDIFHHEGREVWVTEGLVRQCKTDGQLAAVLCQELGKMVAEREALASPAARVPDRGPPPEVRVGNDQGGAFGASDGTRLVELARADKERHRPSLPPPPPPPPEVLARVYLQQAGFAATDLEDVLPLLRQAEEGGNLERQLTAPPAAPARP